MGETRPGADDVRGGDAGRRRGSGPDPRTARRRFRPIAAAAVWLALPCLASACIAPGESPWNGGHASIGGGYFDGSVDGSIETFSGGLTSVFDLEDNGGQDGSDSALYAVANAGLAPLELRLGAFRYENSGTGTFTGDFLGTSFAGAVESEFTVGAYQALLLIDVVNVERIRVAAIAGASALDLEISVEEVGGVVSESADEVVPVPLVGGRVDLKVIGGLRIGATASFFPLEEIDDFEVDCYDFEAGAHLEVLPSFELFAIYRRIVIDAEGEIDDSDAAVDLELGGPVFGVALTF